MLGEEAEDQNNTEKEEYENVSVSVINSIYMNKNIEKEILATNLDPVKAKTENGLLVDSGSTSHIVNEDKGFIEVDDNFKPQNHMIELADGTITKSDAQKKGTVKMNLTDENGEVRTTYLHDALYCPNYPHNLFSVRAATAKGAEIHFTADHDELLWDNVKYPIQREGKLYFLYKISTAIPDVQSRTLNEWHKVLGHCNCTDILKLEGLVDGMKITKKDDAHCSSCILGKQTVNRSRVPDLRAEKPIDFVHSDLAGPIEPVAKDGYKYSITFTDDYSNTIFVYFLKEKSDAVHALNQFIADSAPYGKMTRIRTDNGGEYVSNEFKQVLIEKAIKHEPSAPYCPHQNGTAERANRTIYEMARCMLIDSNVPRYLWSYAVMAAVYTRNRCLNKRTGQTPYYMLTGQRPNLKKMQIFGSVCYGRIDTYKKKLDPRSQAGIFVGYEKNGASFLVYYPNERKVKRHGMVTFTNCYSEEIPKRKDINIPNNNYEDNPHNDNNSDNIILPNNVTNNLVENNIENNSINDIESEDETELNDNNANDDKSINQDNMPRHHPIRIRNKPSYLNDYINVNMVDRGEDKDVDFCYVFKQAPKSYTEAMKSSEADLWKKAMDTEMNSLNENETFEVVELPEGKSIVGGRWVYDVKEAPDGSDLYKARYVAKGYSQTYGVDYFSTFAPTARMSTIRTVIQIGVNCDYLIHQMDVRSAYLNAPIDCDLYVDQPKGYEQKGKGTKLVCRLLKSLYGLKQSANNWRGVLCQFFADHDFVQSKAETCVFIKCNKKGKLICVIWVDDIIVVASTEEMLIYGKKILKDKFRMKDLGEIRKFLGINFERKEDGSMTMDQTKYLNEVLTRFGMEECNPRSTPCELKPSQSDDKTIIDEPGYRAAVGSLVYAMTCTRPDLSWVVTKLSQSLSCPTSSEWTMLKQVFRYVKGTIDRKLTFTKTESLNLVGFSDSDYAADEKDRRSTTGYYFSLNSDGPAISWKSRKQPTVALSTCEAEYMALCETTQEALYLKQFLQDLDEKVNFEPIHLYGDNQGSLALSKNPSNHSRTKHIDVKYHFIRDCYADRVIDIHHVPTNDNAADAFTKSLPRVKLDKFCRQLFGV